MIWSGLTILAFVIYHILHFTVRVGNEYDTLDRYKTAISTARRRPQRLADGHRRLLRLVRRACSTSSR